MTRDNGELRLSASDLMRFSECHHATWLDLSHLNGHGPDPAPETEDHALLSELGERHEKSYIQSLTEAGKRVTYIESDDFESALARTRIALASGAQIIAQGALAGLGWGGIVDFLERVETASELGPWSYQVVDTKLKRTPDPKHILQLVVYSDLLARIQGLAPEHAHLQLGRGDRSTHRLVEYADYVRGLQTRLKGFVQNPTVTRPVPCAACDLCRWRDHCKNEWKAQDSPYLVAGIRKSQVKKLEESGVSTMTVLAQRDTPIPRLAADTLSTLRTQARLQVARKTGKPAAELRPHAPGKGFDLLPAPSEGDLFYDIEGDPHYRENGDEGLEYLHGVWDGDAFNPLWAHSHTAEKQALVKLFALFEERIALHPDAHIYHYAPYELTALRRITTRYGFGEEQLDQWQREGRFVDLYAVVRGGLFVSEDGYSLKDLEVFYDLPRKGEVTTSGGSIVAYENWRRKHAAGDDDAQAILHDLEEYNRIDCISTERARDWLLKYRPTNLLWRALGDGPSDAVQEALEHEQEMHDLLDATVQDEDERRFLFDLFMFHRRESKPAAWAVFDAVKKEFDELVDDLDCLAGLEARSPVVPVKQSVVRSYSYPEQETKLRPGKRAIVSVGPNELRTVTITQLDRARQQVSLKIGSTRANVLGDRLHLLPEFAFETKVIKDAVRQVVADHCASNGTQAASDLLARRLPRFTCPSPLTSDYDSVVDHLVAAVRAMDNTVLPVQGPPGTGKTYVTARGILALVRDGHRVAVTSNSHEAIRNVLLACDDALKEGFAGLGTSDVQIVHRVNPGVEVREPERIQRVTNNGDSRIRAARVVGGTAWLLCRPELEQSFDYLFVDEAGQVSLANLLGMSRCARNLVLIGDPRQLPQVIQGAHPPPANSSCLDWMLGESKLVEGERGLFLPETWRMHPNLSDYVSTQFYEGRVEAHPSTANQAILAEGLPTAGAFRVEVPHEGRMQVCREEIDAIKSVIRRLLKGRWTDRFGNTRPLARSDIIVVAPFNAQVNALTAELDGIRVGTVDKFQGQEAPVALVSMTSSSANDTPRGLNFLLSRERVNVALSRGKALSLAFSSPRLLESRCATVEQLRLVNALCALPPLVL